MSSASVVCLSFCCFVAAPAGDATKAAATSSRMSRFILPPFSNAAVMGRLIISHAPQTRYSGMALAALGNRVHRDCGQPYCEISEERTYRKCLGLSAEKRVAGRPHIKPNTRVVLGCWLRSHSYP